MFFRITCIALALLSILRGPVGEEITLGLMPRLMVQELTAYENILLPVMLDGRRPDEDYIRRIVEMLGLEDRLEHLPSAMSGGQQQRVAIARALANKPSVVFADEPTGNLDARTGREVLFLLKYTGQELGVTLILVTHDLGVAEQADRIMTLEDGRIIRDTRPAEAEES